MADCVKVAVRVRPLVPSEISKGSQEIIEVIENHNQVYIKNTDKSFSFNYAFSQENTQDEVYEKSVRKMVENLFKGYNVTILAYGQTGSGKTHTMGTVYSHSNDNGVIPSAVKQIFNFIKDNFCYDFTISVSFIELYQENLYDLLSGKNRDQCVLEIREDSQKGIHIPGLTEVQVNSGDEVLQALNKGSAGRATASTNMNSQSSRSHAVFTINICMQNKENCLENKTAKLHLVDLAGSERQKKTGAVGTTFKEGVNINKGLLALGNVISCLGDENKQGGFVPYRDSSLTRLLKDSLGGNSITLMIACVSPADYNLEETLSTLRYADRARKIKNKPIVNEDPKAAEINQLKKKIRELQLQIIDGGGSSICPAELELLKKENVDLRSKVRDLTLKLSIALQDNTISMEKFLILQSANEQLQKNITELKLEYETLIQTINDLPENTTVEEIKNKLLKLQDIQDKFNSITLEQEKIEQEIRDHEDDSHNSTPMNNSLDLTSEFEEKHETHAAKQVEMTTQIKEISTKLLIKQRLAEQLISNMKNMAECTLISENESKINALEKEKNELLQQLKAFQEGKTAENRRKRVQELEVQIQELKKKIQGQDRLIKMKDNDMKRIDILKREILQMKQTRVKLIRTMREDSDKFRQWKLQRERELAKLKQEDRKKELQITQMKAMNTKQQNITRRKIEEAAALTKRLRDMMKLKKQVQESKNTGKVEKIGNWLKHEFEVFVGIVEAKATLKGLIEDRATLQQQLEYMKSNQDLKNSPELKQLKEDIEMRSLQIQDLQQKILDSDDDAKSKTRFDNIQTMSEAKFALKSFFEQAGQAIEKSVQNNLKLHEFQDNQLEMRNKLENCEKEIKKLKDQHSQEFEQMQNDYEQKIAVLLEQINGNNNGGCNQCEKLQEKSDKLQEKVDTISSAIQDLTAVTPNKKKPSFKVKKGDALIMDTTFNVQENVVSDDSLIIEEDDLENDPDWRKTPLGKRILEEKRKFPKLSTNLLFSEPNRKRSSGDGCTCKTNCSKRCGCRKFNKGCTASCKCNSGICENRNADNSENSQDTSSVSSSDDSFKKPRLLR